MFAVLLQPVSSHLAAHTGNGISEDRLYPPGPPPDAPSISCAAPLSPADSLARKSPPGSFFRRAVTPPDHPAALRLGIWAALSIAEGLAAYEKTIEVWGKPSGKFHLKRDAVGDRMALTDEASHLFIAYKLTQAARLGYRWSGLSPSTAVRAGAIQAGLYMLAVEFPLDAYNPAQGFGISDFIADLVGVGLAWYRAGRSEPRWDLKISVKSQFFRGDHRLIAHTDKQYDDYIYWLTYRVSAHRYDPLVVGIGYSTHHAFGQPPNKELHFCLGTSFSEIGRMIGRRTELALSPAELYFWGIGPRVHWR